MDYATVKCDALPLQHLKVILIAGFTKQKEELLLMDLLFKKTTMIKSMIVKLPQNKSWRVEKIPSCRQLMQTWISKWKFFSVSSVEYDEWVYKYVEEEYMDLYPAHSNVS